MDGDRFRHLGRAGRDHEDDATTPRAPVASGDRHLSRTAWNDRAGGICVSRRGFVSPSNEQRHFESALLRLGYAKDEIGVSGFRATASTLLNEMGRWNPDAIERQLAHMEENDVRPRLYACRGVLE
jgi:hypothetical protein